MTRKLKIGGTAILPLGSLPALVKAPLMSMAAFPAACAYLLSGPPPRADLFLGFIAGTLLAGFGASALNQWSERDLDAAMERTRQRPIPAGTISANAALGSGLLFSAAGPALLFALFPPPAGLLALGTIILYWLVYTPLKQQTPWCTEIGALAGALPPLMGSAAASGGITPIGLTLGIIVFLWQMPHFHPIAWRYRHDYRKAGFRMLAAVDESGRKAAGRSFVYAVLLLGASAAPVALGAGPVYWIAAAAAGVIFLHRTRNFAQPGDRDAAARALFRFSLIYLAVLLSALLLDHWIRGA